MTPDGTSVLGAIPLPNLYLSTGHATLGGTTAAGMGRVMANVLSGREPEIDMSALGLERYDRREVG